MLTDVLQSPTDEVIVARFLAMSKNSVFYLAVIVADSSRKQSRGPDLYASTNSLTIRPMEINTGQPSTWLVCTNKERELAVPEEKYNDEAEKKDQERNRAGNPKQKTIKSRNCRAR